MKRLELIVSLDTIVNNAREIRKGVDPRAKMLAVVKADAYGHGAVPVARALEGTGVADAFAVATPGEGAALRKAGVSRMIAVLGGAYGEDAALSAECGLSQAVFDGAGLMDLERAAEKMGKPARAHLKADTGMSRIGVRGDAALDALLDAWARAPMVKMEGMFTHFCWADGDEEFTRRQFLNFTRAASRVRARGYSPLLHCAASTAMLKSEYALQMVRAGIALYGEDTPALAGRVSPAQTLVSRPVRLEWIEEGETVGYSRAFRAPRRTRVMTVPCGYGDGYPRALSGRADVLVNGRRCPMIGNICMDMLMADATDAGEIAPDAPVVLLGAQGAERITPSELARKAGTISYEIMLGFSPRVDRRWEGNNGSGGSL